jgi:cellulose synthase/poly-beta-1,6-N-acetylglucosamine synthase-like glycosyltransferase
MQVLVGDDQSEDDTASLVESFIEDRNQFRLVRITEHLGKARGKANVLAQLAKEATGEFLLVTDADITVNNSWGREITGYFADPKMAIVSGVTIVEDTGTMGRMQEIDWMYFMGLLTNFSRLGLNCTAVGNNMAMRTSAYRATGGYENMDFSVTEDYKIYKEVRKLGWKTRNILNHRVINRSKAIRDFTALMHQRKRWLIGARELPLYWWLLFGLFGLFAPAIIVLFFIHLKLALIFYLVKLVLQSMSVVMLQEKMNVNRHLDYLLAYELYSITIALSTQVFYLWPVRLQWKNRSYSI